MADWTQPRASTLLPCTSGAIFGPLRIVAGAPFSYAKVPATASTGWCMVTLLSYVVPPWPMVGASKYRDTVYSGVHLGSPAQRHMTGSRVNGWYAAVSVAALLALQAGCAREPDVSPSPVPVALVESAELSPTPAPSPTPPATATPEPTPAPTPTFDPGQVILPLTDVPTRTPTPVTTDPLAIALDAVGFKVNVIRELSSTKAVDRELITREDLGVRLRELFEEDREETYQTQRLFSTLGILDKETDLFELLLGLYGEGVLGYFRRDEKKLFVVKDAEEFGPVNERTYAHEFVHNLQQQHFDSKATVERLKSNTDALRAFNALEEGDARLAELLYIFEHMEEDERAASQGDASAELIRAFRAAPHVIQRSYIFPYVEGLDFAAAIYQTNGWDALNRVYEQLPASTEQILHPEKYAAGDLPVEVSLPNLFLVLGTGWTRVRQDTMGEFMLLAYLETGFSAEQAAVAAEGWGGDRYALYTGPDDESALILSVAWDTEQDSREFYDTFIEFTQARTGAEKIGAGEDPNSTYLPMPGQVVFIGLEPQSTLVIFAPDLDTVDALKTAVMGESGG